MRRAAMGVVAMALGACAASPTDPSQSRSDPAVAARAERSRECAAMANGDRQAVPDLPEGEIVETFDWDGDGCPEVVLSGDAGLSIWSHRGDRVERYAPAETLVFDAVADADADGRPDLVQTKRYTRPPPDCVKTERAHIGGPITVLHSRSDGTFSDHDEAARAYVLRQCPERPSPLLVGAASMLDPHRSLLNIACARMWGGTGEQVEAQIRTEWPKWADDYHAPSARGLPCFWSYDLLRQADLPPALALY